MESFLYPFANLKEFYVFIYLVSKTEISLDKNLIRTTFNSFYNKDLTNVKIDSIISKFFPDKMKGSYEELKSTMKEIDMRIKNQIQVINPPINNCLSCNTTLKFDHSKLITHYTLNGPKITRFNTSKCYNCHSLYSIDSYKLGNDEFYYSFETDYILLTNETVFESKLILNLDANIANIEMALVLMVIL